MPLRPIMTMTNGSKISFGRGRFDGWCIYVERVDKPDEKFFFPLDSWYFAEMARIDSYEPGVYEDFVKIYNETNKKVDKKVLEMIVELAGKYTENHLVELIYAILYAGMIAEENKYGTKLGKRIKRLGMYQTLVEKLDPNDAANFSRGMKWQEIDEQCQRRGF
jgi:hypothetical protein